LRQFSANLLVGLFLSSTTVLAGDATGAPATLPVETPAAPGSIESKYLKNIRQLTTSDDFAKAGEGYFSPDGKTIIFSGRAA